MKTNHLIQFIYIFCIIHSSAVYSCGKKDKPTLNIKTDNNWSESSNYCIDYRFIFPTEFNDELIESMSLSYGAGKGGLEFILAVFPNYNEASDDYVLDGTSSGVVCANPQWMAGAKLQLSYKAKPQGGWSLLCSTIFEYDNLNDLNGLETPTNP